MEVLSVAACGLVPYAPEFAPPGRDALRLRIGSVAFSLFWFSLFTLFAFINSPLTVAGTYYLKSASSLLSRASGTIQVSVPVSARVAGVTEPFERLEALVGQVEQSL